MNAEQMKQRLLQTFPHARHIEVFDLTGTEDHWEVSVDSEDLRALSRVERQRRVMDAFGPELASGEVHALSIRSPQTRGV